MTAPAPRPTSAPLFIDVSPNLAGHLVIAIRLLREWATRTAYQLPPGLAEFQEALTSRAMRGQAGTAVDDLFQVRDGQSVTPRLLTYEDAASALACSDRSVKRLVAGGQLRAVRVGGTARIRLADLDAYVDGLPSNLDSSTGAAS